MRFPKMVQIVNVASFKFTLSPLRLENGKGWAAINEIGEFLEGLGIEPFGNLVEQWEIQIHPSLKATMLNCVPGGDMALLPEVAERLFGLDLSTSTNLAPSDVWIFRKQAQP